MAKMKMIKRFTVYSIPQNHNHAVKPLLPTTPLIARDEDDDPYPGIIHPVYREELRKKKKKEQQQTQTPEENEGGNHVVPPLLPPGVGDE